MSTALYDPIKAQAWVDSDCNTKADSLIRFHPYFLRRLRKAVIMEEWKDVVGYESYYKVSNKGRVKVKEHIVNRSDGTRQRVEEHEIKPHLTHQGYLQALIRVDKKNKYTGIHRLVAEAFIDNPEKKPLVNHKDGNKANNSSDNLEWATASENAIHAYRKGLRTVNKGGRKLDNDDIRFIKQNHIRCKESGLTSAQLAKMFSVHKATIDNVISGRTWREIS